MAGRGAAKRAKKRRKQGGTTTALITTITLTTVPKALSTFEGIIKAFAYGKIKRPKYTGLIYGLNAYTQLLRLKIEYETQQKIEKLEKLIREVIDEQKDN